MNLNQINELIAAQQLESKITFSSREDYLLFVSDWKRAYRQLSAAIRADKLLHKESQRIAAKKPRLTNEELAKLQAQSHFMVPDRLGSWTLPPWPYGASCRPYLAQLMLAYRHAAKRVSAKARTARLEVQTA